MGPSPSSTRAVLGPDTDDSLAPAPGAWPLAFFERDHDVAPDAIIRALAITPNSPIVLSLAAMVHAYAGHFDVAITQDTLRAVTWTRRRVHA